MARIHLRAFVFLWAAGSIGCFDDGEPYYGNTNGTQSVCEGQTSLCDGPNLRACRDGIWIEEPCEVACAGGRCTECHEGDRRCADASSAQVCQDGRFVAQDCGALGCDEGHCGCPANPYRCGAAGRERCQGNGEWVSESCPSDRTICREGDCLRCVPGSAVCLNESASKVCSDNGLTEGAEACPQGCDAGSGRCVEYCAPGHLRCRSDRAIERCTDEGNRYVAYAECDVGAGGERCFEGECRSSCADAEGAMAPSGCLFHGIPMDFLWVGIHPVQGAGPPTTFHIINPDAAFDAFGSFRMGAEPVSDFVIHPGQSVAISAPGRTAAGSSSDRVLDRVVEIRSTRPLFVVQHLDLQGFDPADGEESLSGDTAFLLPVHLIANYGKRYRVLTQPGCDAHANVRPGGFTVVSTVHESTSLTVTFAADTFASPQGDPPAYPANEARVVPLAAGEVIHFRSRGDLTGTLVEASAPVAIFNGGIARVPCEAGHVQTQLLEQIMPVALWGAPGESQTHVVAARRIPTGPGSFVGEEKWVALTDESNNELTLDPPPIGGSVPYRLSNAGSAYVVQTAPVPTVAPTNCTGCVYCAGTDPGTASCPEQVEREFTLESTKPILLGRYYYVQSTQGGSTFTFERPLGFWRSLYHVRSVGSGSNRLLLIVPTGGSVKQGGVSIAGSRRAGPAGYEVVEIGVLAGVHRLSSETPFGLLVYGFTASGATVSQRDCYSYAGPVGFADAL